MRTLWIGFFVGLAWLPVMGDELDLKVGSVQPPGKYQIHAQGVLDGVHKGSIAEGKRIINFEIGVRDNPFDQKLSIRWRRNQQVGDRRFSIQRLANSRNQQFARVTVNSDQAAKSPNSYPATFIAPVKKGTSASEMVADVLATAMSYKPFPSQSEPLDWEAIRNHPAGISVLNMAPMDLKIGEGKHAWVRIPKKLREYQTQIFAETGTSNGIADFEVTTSGYALLVCNYSYQGNQSGDWIGERWTKTQFQENGWRLLTNEEMGGGLICVQNRPYYLFIKHLKKGEHGRIRCNKYVPPMFTLPTKVATPLRPEELETEKVNQKKKESIFEKIACYDQAKPVLDVDPYIRSTKKIKVPTGLTLAKIDDNIVLRAPENRFKEIEITLGKKMLPSSYFEISTDDGEPRSLSRGTPVPEPKQNWAIFQENQVPERVYAKIYWYETDIQGGRAFGLPDSSPNFKILWTNTLECSYTK